ncbi:hypothetical protein KY285_001091 [Solanum tuberosum]|nr:hypothetical protein KY285_001091 [Solanum tuberosum]
MQPGFDPIELDTIISHDDLEVMGRGKGFTSLSSVGRSVEKRKMIGNNKDETSFPHENLDVMQETARSKPAKEKGQNFTSVCSSKESKNLLQPGFDPIEVDTLISYDDLKVMGQGKRFTSLSSVRGSVEKRKMIGNNKGLNSAAYDQNVVAQKTNVVLPYFDAIECDTSFPHDNHEAMQDTLRSKSGKANREIFTFVDSGRGSTFQQRTLIRTSKGYSAVSSDTNVLAHNKNLRQPDFSQIEHDTAFPHDDLEVMQQDLRSKSARERTQSFTSMGSMRRCAEKRTLNGQSKDSENVEYELDELAQNNNCVLSGLDPMEDDPTLPRDEVEVMQDNQRRKTGSCEFEKVKKVRGPNLCKVVIGLEPGEKLRVSFYHNRVVGDHHALFSRHLGSLVRDRNMCPLWVHSWTDIEEANLEHMWGAITETSTRNARNRSKLSMPHCTGCKPIREINYELGGKHGNPPDMATIFFETRKKDNKLLEPETNKKYDEIQEVLQVEPSLTNIEVVERCFEPQSKSHVVGFGGGITSKDLEGGSTAKTALLEELNASQKEKAALLEELNATRKENESMERRLDNIEKKCEMFESVIFRDPSSPPSSSE